MTRVPDFLGRNDGGRGTSPRPTSVTVLSTLGLLVAVRLIVCDAVSALSMAVGHLGASNPVAIAVQEDVLLYRWSVVATVVRLVLGILLLIGAMGALGLRRWGLLLVLLFAGISLPLSLVDTYMTVARLVPIYERIATTNPVVQGIASKRHVGIPIKVALECAYPVLVLVFLTRPKVRAAFGRRDGQASGGIVPERAGR